MKTCLNVGDLNVIIFLFLLLIIKDPGKIIVILILVDIQDFKVHNFGAEVGELVVETNFVVTTFLRTELMFTRTVQAEHSSIEWVVGITY